MSCSCVCRSAAWLCWSKPGFQVSLTGVWSGEPGCSADLCNCGSHMLSRTGTMGLTQLYSAGLAPAASSGMLPQHSKRERKCRNALNSCCLSHLCYYTLIQSKLPGWAPKSRGRTIMSQPTYTNSAANIHSKGLNPGRGEEFRSTINQPLTYFRGRCQHWL